MYVCNTGHVKQTHVLPSPHLCLVVEHFCLPQMGASLPRPLAPTALPPPVSLGLPVLDFSHQWNLTACGLLHLASSAERDAFKVHPHRSTCQCSFLWLSSTPAAEQTTFCFSTHALMGVSFPPFDSYRGQFSHLAALSPIW